MRYAQVTPWLGKINRWCLQWFFIRLACIMEKESRVIAHENFEKGEIVPPGMKEIIGWDILYPIIPTTGWDTPFYCIGGGPIKRLKLWRKRSIK